MLTDFLLHLRACGVRLSPTERLVLMRALAARHVRCSVSVFYHPARALLGQRASRSACTIEPSPPSSGGGLEERFELDEELLGWLEEPLQPRAPTDGRRRAHG